MRRALSACILFPSFTVSGQRFASSAGDEESMHPDDEPFARWSGTTDVPVLYRLHLRAVSHRGDLKRLRYELFEREQLGWSAGGEAGTPRRGSSTFLMQVLQPINRMVPGRGVVESITSSSGSEAATRSEIEQVDGREESLRARFRQLQRLNRLSAKRRIELVPKRSPSFASWALFRNAVSSVSNAGWSLVSFPAAAYVEGQNPVVGLGRGLSVATLYLLLGFVISPLVHVPGSIANGLIGCHNFLTRRYIFDTYSGQYFPASMKMVSGSRQAMKDAERMTLDLGHAEFGARKIKADKQWEDLAEKFPYLMKARNKMPFGTKRVGMGSGGDGEESSDAASGKKKEDDLYGTLGVQRTATASQIKSAYQGLAKKYHPDMNPNDHNESAAMKFHAVTKAYKILSNKKARAEYDRYGNSAASVSGDQNSAILGRNPMEQTERIFGGTTCKEVLVGGLYRSPWHLTHHAECYATLDDADRLTNLRIRLLAVELARVLDNYAVESSPAAKKKEATASSSSAAGSARKSSLGGAAGKTSAASLAATKRKPSDLPKGKSPSKKGTTGEGKSAKPSLFFTLRHVPIEAPPTELPEGHPGRASKQFVARCKRFASAIASNHSLGSEVLHEIGQAYCVGARTGLKLTPWLDPKKLAWQYQHLNASDAVGFGKHVATADRGKDEDSARAAASKVVVKYMISELLGAATEIQVVLRQVVQLVVNDVDLTEEQQAQRCYALWHLGHAMLQEGLPLGKRDAFHGEMQFVEYVRRKAPLPQNQEIIEF